MQPTVSSLADTSSVYYRGRALGSAKADILLMSELLTNGDWRERLRQAIADKKTSMRAVSMQFLSS
jgi:hypothetical protein